MYFQLSKELLLLIFKISTEMKYTYQREVRSNIRNTNWWYSIVNPVLYKVDPIDQIINPGS